MGDAQKFPYIENLEINSCEVVEKQRFFQKKDSLQPSRKRTVSFRLSASRVAT
jgi:hypothetical protein